MVNLLGYNGQQQLSATPIFDFTDLTSHAAATYNYIPPGLGRTELSQKPWAGSDMG